MGFQSFQQTNTSVQPINAFLLPDVFTQWEDAVGTRSEALLFEGFHYLVSAAEPGHRTTTHKMQLKNMDALASGEVLQAGGKQGRNVLLYSNN